MIVLPYQITDTSYQTTHVKARRDALRDTKIIKGFKFRRI